MYLIHDGRRTSVSRRVPPHVLTARGVPAQDGEALELALEEMLYDEQVFVRSLRSGGLRELSRRARGFVRRRTG